MRTTGKPMSSSPIPHLQERNINTFASTYFKGRPALVVLGNSSSFSAHTPNSLHLPSNNMTDMPGDSDSPGEKRTVLNS